MYWRALSGSKVEEVRGNAGINKLRCIFNLITDLLKLARINEQAVQSF